MSVSNRQLEIFVEVFRSRNITRASERLGLTQSAVSAQLKQLESTWGLRLFDRTTRILLPTRAAERAIMSAERILSATSGLTREMRDLTELTEGRLTFVASAGFASTFLPPLLAKFSEQSPGIEIVLMDVPANQLIDKLLSTDAEFGLGSVEGDIPDIVVDPVMRGRMSAIGLNRGSFARKRGISWDELSSMKTVTMGRDTRIRSSIDAALATFSKRFEPTLEVSLYITALSLSAAGFGLSILPDYIVTRGQFPALIAKPLLRPTISRQVSILRKAGRSLSPASAKFVTMVRSRLSSARALNS